VGELVGLGGGKRLNAFASLCAVGNKIFCVAKATTTREAKPPKCLYFLPSLVGLSLTDEVEEEQGLHFLDGTWTVIYALFGTKERKTHES
jgi:hypothetical protein